MKLNRLERYTAYCIMLEELKQGKNDRYRDYYGICSMWQTLIGQPLGIDPRLNMLFPELSNKRTIRGVWWFTTYRQRIAALRQCIEETHPDNPKNKRK